MPLRRLSSSLAVALVATLAVAVTTSAAHSKSMPVRQVLSSKVAIGDWKRWWGNASIGAGATTLSSIVPTTPGETHSALVTTKRTWADHTISFGMNTLSQLRTGTAPNVWETAWVMFRFRDVENYYWFMLKPNGYELGKKQGSDTQIFLATGATPGMSLTRRDQIQIKAQGPRIKVFVNGVQIVDFVDKNPLPAGSVGLYEEDSHVRFDSLAVSSL